MMTAHVQHLRPLMILANMQQGATSNSHMMVAAWPFQAAITPSAEAALSYTSSLQTSGGALPDGLLSIAIVPIQSSPALLLEPLFAVSTAHREASQVLLQGSSCGSVNLACHRPALRLHHLQADADTQCSRHASLGHAHQLCTGGWDTFAQDVTAGQACSQCCRRQQGRAGRQQQGHCSCY